MLYSDFFSYQILSGALGSRTTSWGSRNWNPAYGIKVKYQVLYVHDTGDVVAMNHHTGRVHLLDTITARWGPEYVTSWFRDDAKGGWPPRKLTWFIQQIETVNRCFPVQERLAELPRARHGETCNVCRKPADVLYNGVAWCETCIITEWGGY